MTHPVDGWTVVLAAAERIRLAGYVVIIDGSNMAAVRDAGEALLTALGITPAAPSTTEPEGPTSE